MFLLNVPLKSSTALGLLDIQFVNLIVMFTNMVVAFLSTLNHSGYPFHEDNYTKERSFTLV